MCLCAETDERTNATKEPRCREMPRDDDILVKIYERSTRDRRVNGPLRIVDGSASRLVGIFPPFPNVVVLDETSEITSTSLSVRAVN